MSETVVDWKVVFIIVYLVGSIFAVVLVMDDEDLETTLAAALFWPVPFLAYLVRGTRKLLLRAFRW